MSSGTAYTLVPIKAGDVLTCQGNGLLYDKIPRVSTHELRRLLAGGSGRTQKKIWFQAQCAHYGLPTNGRVTTLCARLATFLASPDAQVPPELVQLEKEKNDEYRTLNEYINSMLSQPQTPVTERTRRASLSDNPEAGGSQLRAPVFVNRGCDRPRKSESGPVLRRRSISTILAELGYTQNSKGKEKKKGVRLASSGGSIRPGLSSQSDSTISDDSDSDGEIMEYLDDIEKGIEILEEDEDGDSQMDPPSPPEIQSSSPPQTPQRLSSPKRPVRSPMSTLERDVVSGRWSIQVTAHSPPAPTLPQQCAALEVEIEGSMNLHLADDKRSLVGEFNLLGMNGVVRSRYLDVRPDGAYARLSYVGRISVESAKGKEKEGEGNQVYGPSRSQSGYLRFHDGSKGPDGRYTLKGTLHGAAFGEVNFKGVREGEQQALGVSWGDFVE